MADRNKNTGSSTDMTLLNVVKDVVSNQVKEILSSDNGRALVNAIIQDSENGIVEALIQSDHFKDALHTIVSSKLARETDKGIINSKVNNSIDKALLHRLGPHGSMITAHLVLNSPQRPPTDAPTMQLECSGVSEASPRVCVPLNHGGPEVSSAGGKRKFASANESVGTDGGPAKRATQLKHSTHPISYHDLQVTSSNSGNDITGIRMTLLFCRVVDLQSLFGNFTCLDPSMPDIVATILSQHALGTMNQFVDFAKYEKFSFVNQTNHPHKDRFVIARAPCEKHRGNTTILVGHMTPANKRTRASWIEGFEYSLNSQSRWNPMACQLNNEAPSVDRRYIESRAAEIGIEWCACKVWEPFPDAASEVRNTLIAPRILRMV